MGLRVISMKKYSTRHRAQELEPQHSLLVKYHYHYYYFLPFRVFKPNVSRCHWSFSDNKSPQVSKTLLSILTDLNDAVDCLYSSSYFRIIHRIPLFIGSGAHQVSRTFINILTDLNNLFEWSPLVLLLSSPPVLVPIFWWLYWVRQLQLVSLSLIIIIIIIIIILLLYKFLTQRSPMVSHWCLSDSKSPQVTRTLLTILADLYNAESIKQN